MQAVRAPAVAGTFYSGNRQELADSVDSMLREAKTADPCPKVIIAPHAGHVYSGASAATAYQRLNNRRHEITRVVLLGPSHRVGFKGIAATSATSYATPLGEIPLAAQATQQIIGLPETGFLDEAHTEEHSIEVHLPFLQRVLGQFELVPLVVGDASKEAVAKVIEHLWGGPETLILISSDLSHFHDYATAQKIDNNTSHKIVELNDNLTGEEACGCRPLNGLLHLARKKGLNVHAIDVRNSGDTAGDSSRVVGYGTYIIMENSTEYGLAQRQRMLQVARNAIVQPLTGDNNLTLDLQHFPQALQAPRATFVTLNINGQLRGCIGSLQALRPLIMDVASNAQAAAFKDPRFPQLTLDEFHQIDIHISVLSVPEEMHVTSKQDLISQIQPGIDGLIIEESGKRATYLPSVWEQLPTPDAFVQELRRKAGLSPDDWLETTKVSRYRTEEFC
jgi:AmmeMemoRadiSam system protein B/AmmeMemoRadiSam system protein A